MDTDRNMPADSISEDEPVVRYYRHTWADRNAYENGPSFNEVERKDVTDEVAALRAERDEWEREADARAQHTADAWAEVERMRPVVEAAEAWRDAPREAPASGVTPLRLAVDAYRGISHDA
jgi:hypothetical protein